MLLEVAVAVVVTEVVVALSAGCVVVFPFHVKVGSKFSKELIIIFCIDFA